MKEITLQCNDYVGRHSQERCRKIEQYIRANLRKKYTIRRVAMKETQVETSLIRPTLTLRYDYADDDKRIIHELDELLYQIGITAIEAAVSQITTRALKATLAGGGAGTAAGTAARAGGGLFAGTLIGLLAGYLIGNSMKDRKVILVAAKRDGKWVTKKVTPTTTLGKQRK